MENVLALYRSAGSLCEEIDEELLADAVTAEEPGGINMSKLF